MIREERVFVATCDISGDVRGKGFPALALGPVTFAGVDRIRRAMPLPAPAGRVPSLPRSLTAVLDDFVAGATVGGRFGAVHLDAYLRFNRFGAEKVANFSEAELRAHYAEIH